MSKSRSVKREPKLWETLLPMAVTFIFILLMGTPFISGFDSIHIPFVMGIACTVFIGVFALGHSWKDISGYILSTIKEWRSVLIIIIIISILMGAWTISGVIPVFIYYGIQIISPAFCLVAICLISSVVAFVTGNSHVTGIGVGVVLIAIASCIGIPAPMAAGAVISGISFGDKMSPLSFTTNLAPQASKTDMLSHVVHMIYTTGVSLLIALVCYSMLGASYSGKNLDTSQINMLMEAIESQYYITPVLMLIPVITIIFMVKKPRAIAVLTISTLIGVFIALVVQKREVADVAMVMLGLGGMGNSGSIILDGLYKWSGFVHMFNYVVRVMLAVIFTGLLEKTGMIKCFARRIIRHINNTGALVMSTIISSTLTNLITGGKYLAICTVGSMYREEYEKRGLAGCNLSRCLEDAGTLIAPLIPWGVSGVVISECLGVPTIQYLPFCFLNIINPIICIIYGYTGITIKENNNERSMFESK